ncbi:hypothetical protein NUW54_g1528 [Trametes sanguinea]|uniref:Uncharacterized protein n=1 Tax=Trametes sanguinea TaxID=158606 RepID=A0ACC1Q990_9APHY|nr:hypothetical protein NUW54_g1528 [Trametes sanguinea]
MNVSEEDIADEIRNALPGTEEIIVQYLAGYLLDLDDAAEDEDVLQVTQNILESAIGSSSNQAKKGDLDRLVQRLAELLKEPLTKREEKNRAGRGTGLVRLDKVMDLSKTNVISSTIAFNEGVDLESINKGKASRVDVKKLEKQEAKLRAKIEKRSKRTMYEGSKLLDQHKKQQTYEEMFMKINPLDAAAASKNKSKDIHLTSIDVNFGSNRILSGASLTLAYGRRYGLIGRNGVGKSTLLRHIAMREVPIPPHITILFVEQEIVGDDTLRFPAHGYGWSSPILSAAAMASILRRYQSCPLDTLEIEFIGDDTDVDLFRLIAHAFPNLTSLTVHRCRPPHVNEVPLIEIGQALKPFNRLKYLYLYLDLPEAPNPIDIYFLPPIE